jgi:uncharacterized protein YndB with AHSA1/START domain
MTKKISQHYPIRASLEKVWQALIDPKHIEKWGAGPATMDGEEGTEFSLWGGEIYGKNIEIIPQKRLVQEWFSKTDKWDEPSILTITLTKKADGTTMVDLLHENVPSENIKDIEEGWEKFYMGPLKEFIEKEV